METVIAPAQRDQVHVFFVTGVDPFDYANLRSVRNFCRQLGYRHTHLGQVFSGPIFAGQIRKIREQSPEARIVVVGYSLGANAVCRMVRSIERSSGDRIDRVVYLGGNLILNSPYFRPPLAGKVLNIEADDLLFPERDLDGAENHRIDKAGHFDVPTHDKTLRILAKELNQLAMEAPPGPSSWQSGMNQDSQ